MEQRFGTDFSAVRMHTGPDAAELAQSVQARAFTTGTDVYFGEGGYRPGSASGLELMAHELTHVVQQTSGAAARPGVSQPDDAAEVEARAVARSVGAAPTASAQPPGFLLAQLQPAGNRALARLVQREPLTDAPAAQGTGKAIADMTVTEKLVEAYNHADIGAATRAKILSMITPEALVTAILGFAAVFVAAQFTPVGWAADIAFGLTAVFVGSSLLQTAEHLINFAGARSATTPEQLDYAGQELARAFAEVSVDALILLITHTKGGGSRGGPPYDGPPPHAVVLGTAGGRLVAVAAETIPAEVAAGIAAPAGPMIMAMSGRPREEKPKNEQEAAEPDRPPAAPPGGGKPPTPLEHDPGARLVWGTRQSKIYHEESSAHYEQMKQEKYPADKGRLMTATEAEFAGYRAAKTSEGLEAARVGVAEHAMVKEAMRPFEGMPLENGWEILKVERTVGGRKRVDELWLDDGVRTGSGQKRIFVFDTYTGKVEPPEHNQKGWGYAKEPEIKKYIDQGYQYYYAPAIKHPDKLG